MFFIFKTMIVVLFWWVHLASGYSCVLDLVAALSQAAFKSTVTEVEAQ